MDIKSHIEKRISKCPLEDLALLKEDLAKLISAINNIIIDSSLLRAKIAELMATSTKYSSLHDVSSNKFKSKVSTLVEPNTFQEANLIPHWRKAMSEELQALEENCDSAFEIEALKASLHQTFAIKDLGKLKYFLGIEMATSRRVEHLNIVKRIICYLNGSIDRGILMRNNHSTEIHAYTNVDWVGNAIDRKSTTGYCTFFGGNIVTWKSKKQQVIARSSAEVEYRAMAATACELIWLKGLLLDRGLSSTTPMSLMCDNQADMHIDANPVFHERTKHIEVGCHFIRA
ncbi:uncharacterized protein LOC125479403 [Pyrus x bretschneideri]|uniref:uncharacterized protein LOC125479403 n=1 Tax=Pyrus x bretschneideri TaxID=225117 RepID=UPI00202F73CA|nr:uncharacterized protein LOC125479403 [Pyrus x bretschneideri]